MYRYRIFFPQEENTKIRKELIARFNAIHSPRKQHAIMLLRLLARHQADDAEFMIRSYRALIYFLESPNDEHYHSIRNLVEEANLTPNSQKRAIAGRAAALGFATALVAVTCGVAPLVIIGAIIVGLLFTLYSREKLKETKCIDNVLEAISPKAICTPPPSPAKRQMI